ncbi:hypothetical protein KIPB_013191, partial [Kipferlia bialata]|eukprot:g13191.t1
MDRLQAKLAMGADAVGNPRFVNKPRGHMSEKEKAVDTIRSKAMTQRTPCALRVFYLKEQIPPVLMIHLQRFQMSGASRYGSSFVKDSSPVIYPEYLDIERLIAPTLSH